MKQYFFSKPACFSHHLFAHSRFYSFFSIIRLKDKIIPSNLTRADNSPLFPTWVEEIILTLTKMDFKQSFVLLFLKGRRLVQSIIYLLNSNTKQSK